MTDDFVDRLARRAGIKKVIHCTYRIPAYQNAKPEYAAVNLLRPFKQQIPRARCLLATAGWREATRGHSVRGTTPGSAPESAANRR